MASIRIRKGDMVKVLAGKDRGKSGKVLNVNYKKNTLTAEGLNFRIRHQRPRKQGQKGQRVSIPTPLALGKVMLICPNCSKPTRVGFEIIESGKKQRICKKCKGII